jgi:hypothetical protein
MTRALAIALALICTTPASAGPLLGRVIFDIDHEDGCSRSFATRAIHGALTLEVRDDSTTTMSLEIREINIFGPSRGGYQQGELDLTDRRTRVRKSWSGLAEQTADGWTVRLDHLETAHVDQPPQGELPLPPPSASAASLVLECRPILMSVYPSARDEIHRWDTSGEQPETVDVLACVPDQELFDLVPLITVNGALILGAGEGIAASARHSMGGVEDRLVLRREAVRE